MSGEAAPFHASEDAYRLVVESTPNAMVMVGARGRIVLVNRQAEALFGYDRSELLGREIEMLVPERFRRGHPQARDGFFASPQTRSMGAGRDLYGLRKDGAEVPVEIGLNPIATAEGSYVLAAIIDITERKRAEERFRLVVEAAPNAMVMVDKGGVIVLVNSQTERLFGYSRQDLVGRRIETLVPERFRAAHPGHRDGFFSSPRTRSMGAGRDLFGLTKEGREVPVEIGLNPIATGEGSFVLASIIDITERKRAEEERLKSLALEEDNRRIAEANRLKNRFMANMSHELRTPLNAIIGFSELLHDGKVGRLAGDQAEYVGHILTSSRHLLQLINDILDLAKLEAGRMEFHPEPASLAEIVGDAQAVLAPLAAKKSIACSVELAAGIDRVVLDPAKLKQVLYNYLSNAIKFTPEGGRVRVSAYPSGEGRFTLRVSDNGVGIPPGDMERLFVEFQQLAHPLTKKEQGTGLGLALTRRIVESQGGRVWAEREAAGGTSFFAELPLEAKSS